MRLSCLYMRKTTKAIMTKYMIWEMKSPYRNTDGFPDTGEVVVAFSDDRFPVGSTRPTMGLMRSLTSEFTTADEATPMTKPMARPTTPKVWRKSMNSLTKPFFFSEAFSILSMVARSEFLVLIMARKTMESRAIDYQ